MTVKLYSKPACMQCRATKKALDKTGITYEIIDLSDNEEALNHVTQLGYVQAPVVEAGEQHWSGFRPEKIKELATV